LPKYVVVFLTYSGGIELLDYILRFRSTTMADKYRIAHDGPDFIVNYDAGVMVGVYQSEQEANWKLKFAHTMISCWKVW
jgi:hypothetical protein